jgi:hypothetical protein
VFLPLISALLAAPPPVRALPQAELVVSMPSLAALQAAKAFIAVAQDKTTFARPSTYRDAVHPLLSLDVLDDASLTLAGVEPTRPLTLSTRGQLTQTCLTVKDPKAYDGAIRKKLERLGTVAEKTLRGVTVLTSTDALGRVLGASLRKGNDACAATPQGTSLDRELDSLAKAFSTKSTGPAFDAAASLAGQLQVLAPVGRAPGAVSMAFDGLTMTAEGKARNAPVVALAGTGASPYATLASPGLGVVRLRVARDGVERLLTEVLPSLPGGAALLVAARKAAPSLTGNMAVLAHRVAVTQGLRTPANRFFALKMALVAETNSPELARSAIASIEPKALALREGNWSVQVVGTSVVLANDAKAAEALVAALPASAGAQAHGAEWTFEGKALARGLAQVPLLEAIQVPEVAGLLAASTELGPLLATSGTISGWLDSKEGQQRAKLVWPLVRNAPDAGRP